MSHLQIRGLYTFLVFENGHWFFISAFAFASLMGCIQQLHLPNDITFIYKLIGNAVTVPQAVLVLAATFDAFPNLDLDPAALALHAWDLRLTADNAVVFLHADRVQLVYNRSFADHCEINFGQLNGLLVAAHAVHFHEGEQAYTPVLPCDIPLDTIIKEASIPNYLKNYFAIFDEDDTDIGLTKWGNLPCGEYRIAFRSHFFGTFTIVDVPAEN